LAESQGSSIRTKKVVTVPHQLMLHKETVVAMITMTEAMSKPNHSIQNQLLLKEEIVSRSINTLFLTLYFVLLDQRKPAQQSAAPEKNDAKNDDDQQD
tara:strand:- start:616 stop:909 length:294 start_codon:yes stop_codon:yes gene_type:complete